MINELFRIVNQNRDIAEEGRKRREDEEFVKAINEGEQSLKDKESVPAKEALDKIRKNRLSEIS